MSTEAKNIEDNSTAPLLTPAPLQNLQTLSADYKWATVLQHATRLRAADEDGSQMLLPHEKLVVAAYRILALLQTRQLDRATAEINELGSLTSEQSPYLFEAHSDLYPGRRGSFVPFALHAVCFETALRGEGAVGALDALYAHVEQLGVDDKTQRATLLGMAAAAHARLGQRDAAVDVVIHLAREQGGSDAMVALSRALLNVGDVDGASAVLTDICLEEENSSSALALQRALVAGAQGEFKAAAAVYDSVGRREDDINENYVYAREVKVARNNGAVCLLHMGELEEATEALDKALDAKPLQMLDEGVVFNMVTLYELALGEHAHTKKEALGSKASNNAREGFNL